MSLTVSEEKWHVGKVNCWSTATNFGYTRADNYILLSVDYIRKYIYMFPNRKAMKIVLHWV